MVSEINFTNAKIFFFLYTHTHMIMVGAIITQQHSNSLRKRAREKRKREATKHKTVDCVIFIHLDLFINQEILISIQGKKHTASRQHNSSRRTPALGLQYQYQFDCIENCANFGRMPIGSHHRLYGLISACFFSIFHRLLRRETVLILNIKSN